MVNLGFDRAQMSEHTPTPWGRTGVFIESVATEETIAELEGDSAFIDGNFIVRAVNCHDELVAALRDIEKTIHSGVMAGTEVSSEPVFLDTKEVLNFCYDRAVSALEGGG